MRGSAAFGRLFGIPVRVHWSAPLLVALLAFGLGGQTLPAWLPGRGNGFYLGAGLLGALLLVASLMAHELAHALVARRAGTDVDSMTLWALGGVTRIGRLTAPARELWVALAGPLTSLALAGVGIGLGFVALRGLRWDVPAALLLWSGVINLLVAVFNLLPAAPLDGGRVLQAALWWRAGDRERAERQAGRCGQALAVLMLAGGWAALIRGQGVGLWLLVVGGFLAVAAAAEIQHAKIGLAVRGRTVGELMTAPPLVVPDWTTVARCLADSGLWRAAGAVAVVDLDGRPSGVVRLRTLLAVPERLRGGTRVRDVFLPLGRCATAGPEAELPGPALDAALGNPPLLVLEDGRLVGVLALTDLALLMQDRRYVRR
ncbi:site-2 protease family protein [Streptacidiphilus melanogenes]|uniref:site-2 protease family protein n=1 Tax=Streptacidiphilus melanogenes TaxID=411235 RepID=UPI0005A78A3E|nr:site-2 protease family protein [Streptacidiphilus melanogenes]